jgi:hypothetical protein
LVLNLNLFLQTLASAGVFCWAPSALLSADREHSQVELLEHLTDVVFLVSQGKAFEEQCIFSA